MLNRLKELLPSFGSQKPNKSVVSPESKKTVSLDEKKPVVRETKLSSFEKLPADMQLSCLSFLDGGETLAFFQANHTLSSARKDRTLNKVHHSAKVQKALSNLVRRIDVEKTLAAIKKEPAIFLDALPFPFKLTVTGRGGQAVTRTTLISALDALDEYDVTSPDAKAEPCALIPSIRAMFDKNPLVQAQIDQQIAEATSQEHQEATQNRHKVFLDKIEGFIKDVIQCNEISEESKKTLDDNMSSKLVQRFIETAFQLDPKDKGDLGVVLDLWQLCHDYIYLFNQYIDERDMMPNTVRKDSTQPTLGRDWHRKAWVVDAAVYVALHHFAQLCHLEVLESGAVNVAEGKKRPRRFDMRSDDLLKKLDGTGVSHVFGFVSGTKYAAALAGMLGDAVPRFCAVLLQNFCQTKTAAKMRVYAACRAAQNSALVDEVGTPSSPAATAAR